MRPKVKGPFCRMSRDGRLLALKCKKCGKKMRGACIEPVCKSCGGIDHIVIPLTRKSKKPLPGSLASYAEDYQVVGFTRPQAMEMARLAYGQKAIRKRLEALEALALAQVLGAVEVAGKLHLLSCAKREDKKLDCNCGAEP